MLWQWYRTLIAVRNEHEALRRGDYGIVSSDIANLYAFARRTNNATIIVLHNFLNQSLSNPALTLAASRLSAGTHAVLEILSEKTVGTVLIDNAGGFTNWRPAVDLPAQGTAILRIDAATTSVETTRGARVPQYELNQNYPNPFWSGATSRSAGNPFTTIRYALPQAAVVKLTVYDLFGQEIATLVNRTQAPGEYNLQWAPQNLASGVYCYRLQAGSFSATQKMVLIR
ncbi:T9SS type A sorting domain-containing protein [candidate division KSB1 bacterium]|nr:T9SS type A sorting domain-containing protein [candidate division KSB1 bacterium]